MDASLSMSVSTSASFSLPLWRPLDLSLSLSRTHTHCLYLVSPRTVLVCVCASVWLCCVGEKKTRRHGREMSDVFGDTTRLCRILRETHDDCARNDDNVQTTTTTSTTRTTTKASHWDNDAPQRPFTDSNSVGSTTFITFEVLGTIMRVLVCVPFGASQDRSCIRNKINHGNIIYRQNRCRLCDECLCQ